MPVSSCLSRRACYCLRYGEGTLMTVLTMVTEAFNAKSEDYLTLSAALSPFQKSESYLTLPPQMPESPT